MGGRQPKGCRPLAFPHRDRRDESVIKAVAWHRYSRPQGELSPGVNSPTFAGRSSSCSPFSVLRSPSLVRSGFTIVEVIVAVMILGVGVIGLTGTAAVVMRQVNGGARHTLAANLAHARHERMAGAPCADAAGGPVAFRNVTEQWTMTVHPTRRTARLIHTMTFAADHRATRVIVDTAVILCRP